MKYVVLVMPARAHINPTLGIVRELVKKKHEVIIYNSSEFQKEIENSGATFRKIQGLPAFHADIGKNVLTMMEFLINATAPLIGTMIQEIQKEKPDYIIHDSLNLLGKIVAKKTHTKAICFVPMFVMTPKVILSFIKILLPDFLNICLHLRKLFHIIHKYKELYTQNLLISPRFDDIFQNKESKNIVFTSKELQPLGKTFTDKYSFVGPIIYTREQNNLKINKTQKPIIYISLGSIYTKDVPYYKQWISIFIDTPYQVYLSVGKHVQIRELGNIPENIIIAQYLPQLEILKHADLFITHGGMNSINESLYYGVPMIVMPQINEQRINASRIEQLVVGIWHKNKTIDKKSIQKLIYTIETGDYKKNTIRIGKTLQQSEALKKLVSSYKHQ